MTMTYSQSVSFWQRTFDRLQVAGILTAFSVLPPLIFLALLIAQHHTS